MVPQTVGALIGFLFFVAPGVFFELLRQFRRPAIEQSALQEAARIALWSVLFSSAGTGILVVVRTVGVDILPDPSTLAQDGSEYVADNLGRVGAGLALELLVAFLVAALVDRSLGSETGWVRRLADRLRRTWLHDPDRQVVPFPVWWVTFHAGAPRDSDVHISVRTDDNTVFTGKLGAFSTSGGKRGTRHRDRDASRGRAPEPGARPTQRSLAPPDRPRIERTGDSGGLEATLIASLPGIPRCGGGVLQAPSVDQACTSVRSAMRQPAGMRTSRSW